MTSNGEIFISVDIEASGPVPGDYSMLSLGACLVDDPDEQFSCFLKPIGQRADPAALAVTGLSLEELERTGTPPAEAMSRFHDWVTTASNDCTPVFVGLNAAFDWAFVNHYFHKFLGRNPFGFAPLDIKAFYMGATRCTWSDTKSSRMAGRLSPKLKGTHTALDDARYQAELFRLARDLPGTTQG